MSSLILPRNARPSYKSGYAHYSAESANPELWKGLRGAWFPSMGVTGGNLFDLSGQNNTGTLIDMAPASDWVIGGNSKSPGYVLDFDGSTASRVEIPDSDALSITGELSVFAWVKIKFVLKT